MTLLSCNIPIIICVVMIKYFADMPRTRAQAAKPPRTGTVPPPSPPAARDSTIKQMAAHYSTPTVIEDNASSNKVGKYHLLAFKS